MKELQSRYWIILKGVLFLWLGFAAGVLLFLQQPTWKVALLLMVAIWAFCRFYYFVFYVAERWLDPGFQYHGMVSAFRHLIRRRKQG